METVNKVSLETNSPFNLANVITKSPFVTSFNGKSEIFGDYSIFKMNLINNVDPTEDEDFDDLDPSEPTEDDINDNSYEDVDEEDDDDYFIDIDEEEDYADDLDPSTDDLGKRSDYID